MKKLCFISVLLFCFFSVSVGSVKMVRSIDELENLFINCHPNYSIIIEFPKEITILRVTPDKELETKWTVDYDLNLLWVQPEKLTSSESTIKVSTGSYKDIELKLRVEKETKNLIHSIVLKDGVFELKNILKGPAIIEAESLLLEKSEKVENKMNDSNSSSETLKKSDESHAEVDINKNRPPYALETYFSISGGTQGFEDSSFAMDGEIIVAVKNESGWFFQGAAKTLINSMIKQYGFSLGAGFEPGKMGFFLFGDVLMHKIGEEFNSTTHIQLRPSARYKLSDKVHLAAFVAAPLGAWQYTSVEVPGEPGFGYYNKSLFHAGLDLSAYLSNMFVDLRALIAEGSVFGIDLKAGYELIRKMFVTINYNYQTSGDYEYIDGISNMSRISLGVTFNMRNFESREKDRIIFRPDYPMVVMAKKELDEEEGSDPAITLVGDPTSGYAPLKVSYQATPRGFDNATLEMTWNFDTAYSTKSNKENSQFEYNLPGEYQAWVEGTDKNGKYAKSNIVVITVKKADPNAVFNIKASCGDNGYIQPAGDIKIKPGENASISFGGDEGYGVVKVTIDGEDIISLSSPYIFDNVQKDRTIHVEFGEGIVNTYDIVSSVSGGSGTISPSGTTTVDEGSSQKYLISPADGWNISDVVVDGASVGVPEEYVFDNIKESHVISVEFSETPPTTYTISASSGPNGSISPTGDTEVVEGNDITFTINPDEGWEIDTLTVDGSSTSPNDGSDKYKFSNVNEVHTINVTFKQIVLNVTTSVVNNEGGTITESTTVFWGDDFTVTASPLSSHQVLEMNLNGASIGAVEEVVLNNVKTDQAVTVEFEIKKYTIYASVRGDTTMGSVSPGSVEVEHGSNQTFNFTPQDQYKNAVRYWINGTQYNQAGIASYTFSNVTENATLEVEFDWKYYDIRVTLSFAGDSGAAGHIDPGVGTFTYKAGSNYTFNFIADNAYTEVTSVRVNGNSKPIANTWKFYNLNANQNLDVVMQRPKIGLAIQVDGCACDVWSNMGHSGTNKNYEVRKGDVIKISFSPTDPASNDYYLFVRDNGVTKSMALPASYTFKPITRHDNLVRVKCVAPGDPPPF